MSCQKTLSIAGDSGCDLINCSTEDPVWVVGHTEDLGSAYASELCYLLSLRTAPDYSQTFFGSYDSATNAITDKATAPEYINSGVVYDSFNNKFVAASAGTVYVFDPVTEAISTTFATGSIFVGNLLYVPEKHKIYGIMQVGAQYKMGVIDVANSTCSMLGDLSGLWQMAFSYSPISDALYGHSNFSIKKFSLATNTESVVVSAEGSYVFGSCWDSDQQKIVYVGSVILLVDTLTDTTTVTNNNTWDYSVRWKPFYVSSINKVFAVGYDQVSGEKIVYSYNTITHVVDVEFNDIGYYWVFGIAGAGMFAHTYDIDLGGDGFRKLCANSPPARILYWTMEETLLADRVDSVIGLHMPAIAESHKNPVVTPTGGIGIDAVSGLFGNGCRIAKGLTTTFVNVGWIGPYYTTAQPQVTNSALRQDGNGFSFCFWLKVNSLNTLPAYIEYTKSGFFRVNLAFTNTYAKCQANTGLSNSEEIALPIPTVGVWTFYECYHDAVTDKMGVVINNSTDYPASFTPTILSTVNGTFTIITNTTEGLEPYNSTFDATNSQDFIVDEVLIRMDDRLTVAQRAYLYNGGAGRTWPIALP